MDSRFKLAYISSNVDIVSAVTVIVEDALAREIGVAAYFKEMDGIADSGKHCVARCVVREVAVCVIH